MRALESEEAGELASRVTHREENVAVALQCAQPPQGGLGELGRELRVGRGVVEGVPAAIALAEDRRGFGTRQLTELPSNIHVRRGPL